MSDNTRTPQAAESGVMRSILQDLENGLTHEQAAERLKQLGDNGCRRKERRYNCAVCLDEGRVEIWALQCVLEFMRDNIHPDQARHRVSVVACYCNAGECHRKRIPKFDREQHCQIRPLGGATGRTCNPEAVKGLLEWINDWHQRRPTPEVEDPLFHQGGGE